MQYISPIADPDDDINQTHASRLLETMTTDDILKQSLRDIGIIIVAKPSLTIEEATENGLTVILVNDERHQACEATAHEHDHSFIASGRITYAKAMALANVLITLCTSVVPIDQTETDIVLRINTYIENLKAEHVTHAETETSGGRAFNVI